MRRKALLYYDLCQKMIERKTAGDEQEKRAAWGMVGSLTGIAVNVVLAAVKFIVGMLTGSVSATADAANNLSDAGGSVMSFLSVRIAKRHETDKNPFGFGRMEYLGALGVGILILMMGVELLKSGVKGIFDPQAVTFSWLSLTLMAVSILGKVWLYSAYKHIGEPIQNSALLAAAKDSLSDCIATGAVIVSMLATRFFNINIDGYIGVLVSLFVLKAGYEVISDTVSRLLGGEPDKELGDKLIEMVKSYEYVQDVHDFVMHDYGPGRCMASIHVEVPADGNLVDMHEVIDRMERDVFETLRVPLCVHMDPVTEPDEDARKAEQVMRAMLDSCTPPLKLHDFRTVPGESQINLVFDVVVPASYKDTDKLAGDLEGMAKALDARYHCVIHFDKDYYHV